MANWRWNFTRNSSFYLFCPLLEALGDQIQTINPNLPFWNSVAYLMPSIPAMVIRSANDIFLFRGLPPNLPVVFHSSNRGSKYFWIPDKINLSMNTWYNIKAGRLVGFADCYAVIVLADNATFLLAVNRIAAFRSHSAIIAIVIISCRGSVGRASAP